MTSGIYCIENKFNGKKYVGQSVNLEKRMYDSHKNSKAYDKYVIDNYLPNRLNFPEDNK